MIGEFFVKNRFMEKKQVKEVLKVQKKEPVKKFGAIALELGFIKNDAINAYLEYMDS